MTFKELQDRVKELLPEARVHPTAYPDINSVHLELRNLAQFDVHEPDNIVGGRLVDMLHEAREQIDEMIVKVEAAQREPTLISVETSVKAYLVGNEYWVDGETYQILDDEIDSDGCGAIYYHGTPVVYKPELDQ